MICVSLYTLMFNFDLIASGSLVEFKGIEVKLKVFEEGSIRVQKHLGEYSPFAQQISVFPYRDYEHRGGLWATFVHEFCHALQFQLGGWHGIQGNRELYEKWSGYFYRTYAGKNPAEAEAEVFRWLWMSHKGCEPKEDWEDNWALLWEYKQYFRKKGWGKFLPPELF